jgi:hypothetical protein
MESLSTVRQLLEERRARRTIIEAPTEAIGLDEDGKLRVNGETFTLGRDAENVLAIRAGIPRDFFAALHPPIKGLLFEHLYRPAAANAVRERRLHRSTGLILEDGKRCVGIVDPGLACLSGDDVLQATLAAKPRAIDEARLEVPDFRLNGDIHVSIVSLALETQPRPGDIVYAGIDIRHSDNAVFATQIESYLFRLVCRNGMLMKICRHTGTLPMRLRRAAVHNPRLTLQRVEEMATVAWAELDAKIEAIRLLADERQDNSAAIIRALGEKLRFPNRLIEDIVRALEEDEGSPTGTLWDIVGAISRVGTHSDRLSVATRRFLQELSGDLVAERVQRCPTCGKLDLHRGRLLPRR